jgi:hypothetical protein
MTGTDGWQPKRIKVFLNDRSRPFYDGRVNVMLDGEKGTALKFGQRWEAPDFVWEVPIHCHFVIGRNDPTIRPGRNKQGSAELITNFNSTNFRQKGGDANAYWTQGRIRYRVAGFSNVSVADADALVMADGGSFSKMRNIARLNNKPNRLNIYFVRQTMSRSNWRLGGSNPSCLVMDTRGGRTVNTAANFKRVAISTAHEIGHFFGLPHMCDNINPNPATGDPPRQCGTGDSNFLMFGDGTGPTCQLLSRAEGNTAHDNAESLAENKA